MRGRRHGFGGPAGRCWSVRDGKGRSVREGRAEQGSATVWGVVVVAVLCVVFAGVLAAGQAILARHRAGSAADLAALAAAGHWSRGEAAACDEAAGVAAAQEVRLVRCSVRGETSDVTAEARTGPYSVAVRARAGPAGPVGARLTPGASQRHRGAPVYPAHPASPRYPRHPGRTGLP
ncbi:hypothetical protein BGM19_20760 [Streptomyces agglomeratus]|nr:hypothetical protein BGM19_20760 [Streptomyces agglomeratus]